MAVDNEGPADDVAVPAGELKAIAAPAQVRSHGDDLAVMRAVGSFRVLASQQKVLSLHDAVDALVVYGRGGSDAQLAVQKSRNPPVSVRRSRGYQRGDHRHQHRVLRFVITSPRLCASRHAVVQVRSGDTQSLGHDAHPCPAGHAGMPERGNRPVAATARARSVFLSETCRVLPSGSRPQAFCAPSCRSNSRMRSSICRTARLLVTSSSPDTATAPLPASVVANDTAGWARHPSGAPRSRCWWSRPVSPRRSSASRKTTSGACGRHR